jgi:hypothetical protein
MLQFFCIRELHGSADRAVFRAVAKITMGELATSRADWLWRGVTAKRAGGELLYLRRGFIEESIRFLGDNSQHCTASLGRLSMQQSASGKTTRDFSLIATHDNSSLQVSRANPQ